MKVYSTRGIEDKEEAIRRADPMIGRWILKSSKAWPDSSVLRETLKKKKCGTMYNAQV